MLFKEIASVYSKNHKKSKIQNEVLWLLTRFVQLFPLGFKELMCKTSSIIDSIYNFGIMNVL